ncbi:15167_t:CDS:2 [Cetraspora pellucida]|uniref:15167_t:CDS:1 n=1 Tax=Cetraspora pellucida TaxID=1433469 RepID=A0A9N8WTJ8_9GLOM|nr:15167_t:CDS:2 [Cetraspora pellucida]
MSKFIAVLSGFIASGALLYHFQNEIEDNTSQIRLRLHNTRNQLEDSLPSNLKDSSVTDQNHLIHPSKRSNARPQLPIPSLTQTQNYINHRFIPTFKSTWNEHVTNLANKLTSFDVSESVKNAKSFVEDKWNNKK